MTKLKRSTSTSTRPRFKLRVSQLNKTWRRPSGWSWPVGILRPSLPRCVSGTHSPLADFITVQRRRDKNGSVICQTEFREEQASQSEERAVQQEADSPCPKIDPALRRLGRSPVLYIFTSVWDVDKWPTFQVQELLKKTYSPELHISKRREDDFRDGVTENESRREIDIWVICE